MASPYTIFLVDDDPMHTQMVKDHLTQKINANITTFSTGEDCIANLGLDPTLIVLDYNLNSIKKDALDGIEVLQKIKEQTPDVDVIMLSGQDKIEVAVDTMKYGAFDYVVKNESAFIRTENVVKNILNNLHLKKMAKMYKNSTWFLLGFIVLMSIAFVTLNAYFENRICKSSSTHSII